MITDACWESGRLSALHFNICWQKIEQLLSGLLTLAVAVPDVCWEK